MHRKHTLKTVNNLAGWLLLLFFFFFKNSCFLSFLYPLPQYMSCKQIVTALSAIALKIRANGVKANVLKGNRFELLG